MAGDFNIVVDQDKKLGSYPVNLNDTSDFLDMMQQANLSDAGYCGN